MAETAHQISGFWPMTKHYRQRLVAVIALSFLSFTLPLLLTRNAAAQNLTASKANPKEIASLIEKLKTNDERELDAAIEKLGEIGEPAIPALMAALQDKNLQVRRSAADVLRQIGRPAIPALAKALKNSDAGVRRDAASALGDIGAEAKTALAQLVPLLKDSDAKVRSSAASALESIGAEAKIALPQLVPLLKDSDAKVRSSAASALGSLGAEAKTALPQLVPLLKDSDAHVRKSAASALGRIGAEAKTALPQLVLLLKDSDANVRGNAADALVSIALSLQEKAKTLTSPELDLAVSNLESALKTLAEPQADFSQPTIANLRVYINVLKAEHREGRFIQSIIQNPYIWGTAIYLFLLFGTFAIRPLWLLKIYETLKPIAFKIRVIGADLSLGNLIFLKYHPRVLDAWVAAHIQSTRDEFQKRETVRDRKIIVPIRSEE